MSLGSGNKTPKRKKMKSAWARGISGNRKVVSSKALAGSIMSSLTKKLGNAKPKDKLLSRDDKSKEDMDQSDLKVHIDSSVIWCVVTVFEIRPVRRTMTG